MVALLHLSYMYVSLLVLNEHQLFELNYYSDTYVYPHI